MMEIYPAIDLRGGRVVRLRQGDATQETVYAEDPAAQALAFISQGAAWVHVVDLDRAFGTGDNLEAVRRIIAAAGGAARIQCGGGFRTGDAIASALDAGATRVVIGTAAVTDPGVVAAAVTDHGAAAVAVGLDARDGMIALRGWTEQSSETLLGAATRVLGQGVRTLVYTDITRDGMLSGPDFAGCERLASLGAGVILSGGIASIDDIQTAREAGLAGVILGRALYEGKVDLRGALRAR